MTAPTGGGTVGSTSAGRAKVVRITTGVTAGVVSLALALLLTSFPEVSERFRAEDPASDAFIFAWALVALPFAGVLHTPLALARRARIGAGWALIASYWLYVVLMAAVAWQVRDFFPAPDSSGKAGGLFGGAILMVIGTPVFVVGSGGVFREVREVPGRSHRRPLGLRLSTE
ncbi:hypothetical protein [Streptomyces coeruleorubidus]|uniref:DUF2637 domain-containing protein n=1 Tax=Streptomyces coeruleorubidus TaxID=116188 RepID=A0ABZ0KBC7_STRC4|nr:hypothetical protein [Streptomyces coeruleorubidus]WOT35040.1 hypothetical protein R5U08_13275 [Streptomyces coeruleorubidus]